VNALLSSLKKVPEQDSLSRYRKKSGDDSQPDGQRRKDFTRPSQAAGNLATERLLRSAEVQSRFEVNPPHDVHEQEAEKLAEFVMSAPEKISPGANEFGPSRSPAPKMHAGLRLGSGHPLDASDRAFFEPRFGVNLSHVRLHSDVQGAAAAEALNAQAFSLGSNIVFASDRYRPNTLTGRRLLGHELAHVIQQGSATIQRGDPGRVQTHTNKARIQRQPEPPTSTDPVGFIESQLRVRFTDPDDPRLYIRVQRLQDAFEELTISEASRVLSRLSNSGDELARNFQRLATPSRNRLRAILLRHLPATIEGKVLGWLSFPAVPLVHVPLSGTIEVTPSTAEAGLFEGYSNLGDAQAAAVRRATISAIVLDKKLGQHRVFETGLPTTRGLPDPQVTSVDGPDYQVVEWVNLVGEELPSPQDWSARIVTTGQMLADFKKTYGFQVDLPGSASTTKPDAQRNAAKKALEDAYIAMFEQALPFLKGQFRFSFDFDVKHPSGESKELTTADPNFINVDMTDVYAHGRMKILDTAEDLDYPGTHLRAKTKDALEESPFSYEAYIALAPSALGEEPLETRRVLLHEEAHRAHSRRTLKLIDDWEAQGSITSFQDWLEIEVKNRRISSIDAVLAREGVEQRGWAYNTEVLAEVEGFIAVYQEVPLGKDVGLERLSQMADMWAHSDPEVQELSVNKLRHYYWKIMDQSHREAFDKYVSQRWGWANQATDPQSKQRESFYLRLLEFYADH